MVTQSLDCRLFKEKIRETSGSSEIRPRCVVQEKILPPGKTNLASNGETITNVKNLNHFDVLLSFSHLLFFLSTINDNLINYRDVLLFTGQITAPEWVKGSTDVDRVSRYQGDVVGLPPPGSELHITGNLQVSDPPKMTGKDTNRNPKKVE